MFPGRGGGETCREGAKCCAGCRSHSKHGNNASVALGADTTDSPILAEQAGVRSAALNNVTRHLTNPANPSGSPSAEGRRVEREVIRYEERLIKLENGFFGNGLFFGDDNLLL